MSAKSLLVAPSSVFLAISAFSGIADAQRNHRVYNNPKVGGKKLYGCYSWLGNCKSQQQANAFCKMQDFAFASDFSVTNKFGMYQAKQLGDGGTCTASCTAMARVVCIAAGHDYE